MKKEILVKLVLEDKSFKNKDGVDVNFIQKTLIIPIKDGSIYVPNLQMSKELKQTIKIAFNSDLFVD